MSSRVLGNRGVLLLYHRYPNVGPRGDASAITEHIAAFRRHSRFLVSGANTAFGYRPGLEGRRFDAIVLHYSLFRYGPEPYLLDDGYRELLAGADSYKVAFFQDEHHWCGKRFAFLDEYSVDCVYSLLEPPYAEEVYGRCPGVSRVVSNLPSYVGKELVAAGARYARSDARRPIDIGYRGRPAHPWVAGGHEKNEIGLQFAKRAGDAGLSLDIGLAEEDRLYGRDWHRFIGSCRATLGTESGVTCVDLEDEVREEYERLSANGHPPSNGWPALRRWDGNIPYRTISARHLEAAALRSCQILFEGRYSGLMEPMRQYIPLRKDFSNFDEVIELSKEPRVREVLTANAHRDLVASGELGYERFIAGFDETLAEAGVADGRSPVQGARLRWVLRRPRWRPVRDRVVARLSWLYVEHRALWWPIFIAWWVAVTPFRVVRRLARLVRQRGESRLSPDDA